MSLQGSTLSRDFHYSNDAEKDKVTLEDRNRAWIKILASHLEAQYTGPVLVAVGHMHLVGRQGLLCLLQNEGYTILGRDNCPIKLFKPSPKQMDEWVEALFCLYEDLLADIGKYKPMLHIS